MPTRLSNKVVISVRLLPIQAKTSPLERHIQAHYFLAMKFSFFQKLTPTTRQNSPKRIPAITPCEKLAIARATLKAVKVRVQNAVGRSILNYLVGKQE